MSRPGTQPSVAPEAILLGGLLLGVVADLFLRAPGAFGLNLTIWALTLGVTALFLGARGKIRPHREALILIAVAMVFACVIAWRDAPALKLLALGASATAFALAAFRAGATWIRTTQVFEYAGALAAAGVSSAIGGFFLLFERAGTPETAGERSDRWRRIAPVVRGTVLVLPVLLVVGALFMEADAVFADLATRLFRFDVEELAEHLFVLGFFTWISAGYFRGFLGRSPLVEVGRQIRWRPSVGTTETLTALLLLDLLFLVFVLAQVRTLFAGASLVEVTPGLTFAENARRGFFELVAVSAIVIPVLLGAEQLRRRETVRGDRAFLALAGLQVALLGVVMVSAAWRLRLYLAEYGLTEARFYAAVLLGWLALMLIWLAASVLRGQRERFAFGALVTAFAWIAAVAVANPDAIIARTNVARTESSVGFDANYASRLSADAVPALVRALPELDAEGRCRVARTLLDRWGNGSGRDWRSWSFSRSHALKIVSDQRVNLEASVRGVTPCPDGSL